MSIRTTIETDAARAFRTILLRDAIRFHAMGYELPVSGDLTLIHEGREKVETK